MRNKKLFKSAVIITASLFLFTACGNKTEPVNAEPTETVSEADTEENSESMEPVPSPAVEPTQKPEEKIETDIDNDSMNIGGMDVEVIEDGESPTESSIEADYEIEPIEPMSLWAATNCNLRSGPGTQYDIVGSLSYAQEIIVDGKVEKDGKQWFVLQSDTEEKQMVSGSLMLYTKPAPQTPSSSGGNGSSGSSGSSGGGSAQLSGGGNSSGEEGSGTGTDNPWGVEAKDSDDMDWDSRKRLAIINT